MAGGVIFSDDLLIPHERLVAAINVGTRDSFISYPLIVGVYLAN
jgi:hypothetical protein